MRICTGCVCEVLTILLTLCYSVCSTELTNLEGVSPLSRRRQVRQAPGVSCGKGSIGSVDEPFCVDCFCNGFSDVCTSDEGWYQASIQYSPFSDASTFLTNGVKESTMEFIEVQPLLSSPLSLPLSLSFPSDFLGDKRTAYRQNLSLNLSIQVVGVGENGVSQCEVTLELESRDSIRTKHRLRTALPPIGEDQTYIQVPLMAGSFKLDRYYFRRLATAADVRRTLSNIRMLRILVQCAQPHSLRLYSSRLDFATTNSSSGGAAEEPLQDVTYVEQCSCPPNRIGANCETCANGYTTDPSFGGEFARCVRCFCSFQSDSCDPVSGECTNCTGNTMGSDCEQCVYGYDRALPSITLPCDRCAEGYWASDGRVCTPCNCHPAGSSSPACNQSTGVCDCIQGVGGDRCDECSADSSGVFPNCRACDECTSQWVDKITPLEEQVEATIELIGSLNLTNKTSVVQDIPELDILFDLVRDIQRVLNGSTIEAISSDVNSTHKLIWFLLNETTDLFERAGRVENQTGSLESVLSLITEQLGDLSTTLIQLEWEFLNISLKFDDFLAIDVSEYLRLARTALDRSDRANLLTVNVTRLLNQSVDILNTYNSTLAASSFESNHSRLVQVLADVNDRVDEYKRFIADSNEALCGAENSADVDCSLDCGGVTCAVCGASTCNSLYLMSQDALNTSQRAVSVAEDALTKIQEQIELLTSFLADINRTQGEVTEVVGFANDTRVRAETLLNDLQTLIAQIEQALGDRRVNPDNIGRRENMTLSLNLDLLPNEFFDLLVQINSTIDKFFSQVNVSEEDLRRRVEVALQRAMLADELAGMILSNATFLEEQLVALSDQQLAAEATANNTQQLVEEAEDDIQSAALTLDDTEGLVGSLTLLLSDLNTRLDSLQLQIEQNIDDFERAENLTAIASGVANETEADSLALEASFEEIEVEALAKFEQSVEDLAVAQDIQNRTLNLQIFTQDQLLQVENFERIRSALFTEQEQIRSDVDRVANELQRLDQTIRLHIARNTACLEAGILSKRKRRNIKSKK